MASETEFIFYVDWVEFKKSLFPGDVFHIAKGKYIKGSSETFANYGWFPNEIIKLPDGYFKQVQKDWEAGVYDVN